MTSQKLYRITIHYTPWNQCKLFNTTLFKINTVNSQKLFTWTFDKYYTVETLHLVILALYGRKKPIVTIVSNVTGQKKKVNHE